jgi:hypothetical protein
MMSLKKLYEAKPLLATHNSQPITHNPFLITNNPKLRMRPLLILLLLPSLIFGQGKNAPRSFYRITVYHYTTVSQGESLDLYLGSAYLPALHRHGIKQVGVFRDLANDTSALKNVYVLAPYTSVNEMLDVDAGLLGDKAYQSAGKAFLDASPDMAPYTRQETILLRAFRFATQLTLPGLKGPRDQRVYELRSYESPTDNKYLNKVHMFNEGGEIPLFKRLGFNAVFYADVLSGSHMPNLMYMTTFESMADREAHWKTFTDDAEWKSLSSRPEYQKNVSHADIIFLRPTPYSDY